MKKHLIISGVIFIVLIFGLIGCEEIFQNVEQESETGNTIIVNRTAETGTGTLRQALLDARSGDTIIFDSEVFPPQTPATILLESELPVINLDFINIDASDAGVILDGGNISGEWVNCLVLHSNGNTIRGLQIVNFSGGGIRISNSAQNNMIGGDRNIGSGVLGQGNLIIGNRAGSGIQLQGNGTSYNTITGNLIGTYTVGEGNWGNNGTGIMVHNGASYNLIGPNNIIAYNREEGVQICNQNSVGNTITQNSIHNNGIGIFWNEDCNTRLATPLILECNLSNGILSGSAGAYDTIEIFSDSSNEGEVYEGKTKADENGDFAFSKDAPFSGPYITATAIDINGKTSEFSQPASDMKKITPSYVIIQEGNSLPKTSLKPKESRELEDNRIGIHAPILHDPDPGPFPRGVLEQRYIVKQGFKEIRLAIETLDSPGAVLNIPECSIDQCYEDFISNLAENDITIRYVLSFWDKEHVTQGGIVQSPRFRTEDEIQRYLDFVQFIVHHFKDRIQYYEIWNEPDITTASIPHSYQFIEVEDYINLVKRAIPVIHQEYPEAKIVVGGTSGLINKESQDYLFSILESDIMPLVDVVSWHPMYGSSPEYDWHRQYYYEYPSIAQEIKDVASAHGFRGEFVADEIHWCTPDQPSGGWPIHSETKCAKYLARNIIMHLSLNISITQHLLGFKPLLFFINQNLCTIMAGTQPVNLPCEIETNKINMRNYSFSLPNGNKLVALWTDGVAVENDTGIRSNITIQNISYENVTGIDIFKGFQQELITSNVNGNLQINNLLIRDYPLIIQIK
jgi:hypothetical protein